MTETRATRTNRPYSLLPYDPAWADLFNAIKPELEATFGDNALAIEHIGSTSVPGMLAKPQIDILVLVKDLDLVKAAYGPLAALGFIARGDYIGQHEESFILNDSHGHRLYSIHTFEQGNEHAAMYTVFRDYLRAHEGARQVYIQAKRELNARFGSDDYNAYDVGKEAAVNQLKAEAKAWHDSL